MGSRHPRSAAALAALALSLPAAAGAQTVWTGATGDWFVDGNWSAGVPDANADARIDNAGSSTIGTTGAAAHSVILGYDVPDAGALQLSNGGTLDVAADLSVGYGGDGTLAIREGAIVTDYSGEVGYTIVSGGAHGDALVDGAGSAWNHAFELYVGYGTGTLAITNGASVHDVYGYLGYFPESPGRSSGTATIDGAGSTWTNDANLHIGDSGTGVVTVSNGGALVNGEGDLGFNFDSDGTATITGAGSSWTNYGFLYVGNNGNGTLNVDDGASVGSLGSYAYLSWASASTSGATIDGTGSVWTNANGLYVGFGGTATLTVTNGGAMQNGTFANVGFSPGANGTLSVLGAGSIFGTGGALSIGGNVSGPGGTGVLIVDSGGAVSASAVNIWNTGTLALDHGASIDAATVAIDAPLLVGEGGASIEGDLSLTPAAVTVISVPVGSAGLAVSGTASLGGALTVEFDRVVAPGKYALIEADGGLGGSAFASVSVAPPADMTADVTYDGTHVWLVLASTVDDDLVFRDGFDGPL